MPPNPHYARKTSRGIYSFQDETFREPTADFDELLLMTTPDASKMVVRRPEGPPLLRIEQAL
jgi:hypothetical protein